jgi:hypothetical protein
MNNDNNGQRRLACRRLRTAGAAIGLGALVVGVLPAIAVADSAATATIYYGCVSNTTGTMKVVAKSTVCPIGQYKISWNKLGPQGAQGVAGPQGATGPQGPAGVVNAVTTYSSADVILSTSALTTVGFVSLLPGSYILTAKVGVYIAGQSGDTVDSVSCYLSDGNGNTLDQGQSTLFYPSAFFQALQTLTMTAALSQVGFNGPTVDCHDFNGLAHTYNVSMTAIAVDHLSSSGAAGQGGAGSTSQRESGVKR